MRYGWLVWVERTSCFLALTMEVIEVDPEHYLRDVLNVIADWSVNRVSELLPWRVALPAE